VNRVDTLLAEKGEMVGDLLENLQLVSEDFRNITKTIEAYPSQVLFGEPPPRTQMGNGENLDRDVEAGLSRKLVACDGRLPQSQ
jgi:hypothetical protein